MKNRLFHPVSSVLFVALTLLILLGISCQKNDDSDNNTQDCSVTMSNLAGTYVITKLEAQTLGSSDYTDVTNVILADACMKDNSIVLNTDGTAKYDDKGVACDPSETSTGTWSLSGQQMTITLDQSPLDVSNATVNSYDCKTLVILANSDTPLPGTKIRATLTKQ